ncbi:MAG: CHASE2 domain-containing protein, partial [Desulfobacteraceae bacterium]|nr:CHASE2 domain-containing protein [Desulfobacteraceae bacterium]
LVKVLSNAGAKVLAFDIIFSEPDNESGLNIIRKIKGESEKLGFKNPLFDKYLNDLSEQSDNDRLLADAIEKSKAQVVLGYFFQTERSGTEHYNADMINLHEENSRGSRYNIKRETSEASRDVPFRLGVLPESNISIISKSTKLSGFFNMVPDEDGVVRWIPAVFKFRNELYAPLSIKAIQAFKDENLSITIEEYGVRHLEIGGIEIPTDIRGEIMVNYRGGSKTFPHISSTDVINGNFEKNVFKDKIVLVGATAVGIYDLRATPFSEVFPGVEIHANIIDSVLSNDFLLKPEYGKIFDIMAIIFVGFFLGIVLPRSGPILGATLGIAAFTGYIILCHFLFSTMGWVLNMVTPLCVIVIVYIAITAYRYLVEEGQKRFIKNAFSTYLAPTVVKQLMDTPEKLELGGEKREITAFFSDLQGFTSISEKLSPEELVELLNEFLTEMTDIILEYEGTVDKFEGDAIIAFFGAPNELENHANTACLACIDMQKRMEELRVRWKAENKPELKMRIGLCSGPAVVGNMGSKSRMDYTMMGDTVNTAARLEGVNKVYSIYLLISESTYGDLSDTVFAREVDSINVVGKKEPVKIYEPVDFHENVDDVTIKTVDVYTKGLYSYRDQEWDKAISFFESAIEIAPDDGPSKTMLARCHEYKKNPPGEDWNGSYSMISK